MGVLTAIGMKAGLAAVLALGAAAAVRYLHQARQAWRAPTRRLQVLETAALGQQRAVHLLAVGRRILLIGSSSGQVVMLAEVTEECETAAAEAKPGPRAASGAPAAPLATFGQIISQALSPGGRRRHDYAGRLRCAADALNGRRAREVRV